MALAICAQGAAVVIPAVGRSLDQVHAHVVFLDFQRQVSDLRLKAFREQTAVVVRASGDLRLESGWRYRLSAPLRLTPSGACSLVSAELWVGGRRVMRLRGQADCRFVQVA